MAAKGNKTAKDRHDGNGRTPAKGGGANEFFVRSKTSLAELLGASVPTVDTWLAKGAPQKTASGFDVPKWLAWQRAHKAKDGTALAELNRRLKQVALAQKEFEWEVQRGEYVSRADAERERIAITRLFVRTIESLPSAHATAMAIALRSPVSAVKSELDKVVRECRKQLAGD